MTSALRDAFDTVVTYANQSPSFDVSENVPKGKNRKRAINIRYAGKRSLPFAFIVNSGERKDYHLFYIRNPRSGDKDVALSIFESQKVSVNGSGEITVQFSDRPSAEAVCELMEKIRLQ